MNKNVQGNLAMITQITLAHNLNVTDPFNLP